MAKTLSQKTISKAFSRRFKPWLPLGDAWNPETTAKAEWRKEYHYMKTTNLSYKDWVTQEMATYLGIEPETVGPRPRTVMAGLGTGITPRRKLKKRHRYPTVIGGKYGALNVHRESLGA